MLMKSYSKTGGRCRVTFKIEGEVAASSVSLCGEFNNWDPGVSPMKQLKGGGWSLTLSLDSGREYRFRYWVDGVRWENDAEADSYIDNGFGSQDSLLKT